MENPTSTEQKGFFSDISWKSAIICTALSIVAGGSVGGGVVASKGVKVEGLNQDQADIRYVTKDEAERRASDSDKKVHDVDQKMIPREVFEVYHKSDVERMDRIEKLTQQILENQHR